MAFPALFLDRDGVLIEEAHYLARIDQVRLIPGVANQLARIQALGMKIVVVTNQSGVARAYFPESEVSRVHEYIAQLLKQEADVAIDRFYYCPHHPDGEIAEYRVSCTCRKPSPGMLERGQSDLNLDFRKSWMIGDRLSDLQAGAQVGARTMLVRTGYGVNVDVSGREAELHLDGIFPSVVEATEFILAGHRS